jgi:hypothetical protein
VRHRKTTASNITTCAKCMRTIGVRVQFYTNFSGGSAYTRESTIKIVDHQDQSGQPCRNGGVAISPNVVFSL